MNKREAIQAMLDGERVVHTGMSLKHALYMDKYGNITDGWDTYNLFDFKNEGWMIVSDPVKYSVDIWLDGKPYHEPTCLNLFPYLFGEDVSWESKKRPGCNHKYRITVEELIDD
jgi:hypothetical protein